MPFFGDDAEGVRALSESLDVLATGAIDPLNDVVDASEGVVVDGRIDVDTLSAMQAPIQEAKISLVEATDLVAEILRDPLITEEQKKALVRIYDSFRRENGNEDVLPGDVPGATPGNDDG